jgi:hypothetical protein
MQKVPSLKVALGLLFSPLIGFTALSLPSWGSPIRLAKAEIDAPLCYMRTPDQGLLDLSYLCGPQESTSKPTNPQVVVLDVKRNGNQVVGQVRNDTGKPVRFVIVNYAVASDTGAAESNFTFVTPETLAPGAVGNFQGSLNQPGMITVTSVEWDAQESQADLSAS